MIFEITEHSTELHLLIEALERCINRLTGLDHTLNQFGYSSKGDIIHDWKGIAIPEADTNTSHPPRYALHRDFSRASR